MESYSAQQEIISLGSPNQTFYIIAGGSVTAHISGHEVLLKKGDIVGIFDITTQTHTCSYTAFEDCTLIPYSFEGTNSLLNLLNRNSDLCKLFTLSLCRNIVFLIRESYSKYQDSTALYQYVQQSIQSYQDTCRSIGLHAKSLPFMDSIQQIEQEDIPPFFLEEYYASMRKIISDSSHPIPALFVYGFLSKSQNDVTHMLSLSSKLDDIQNTYSEYLLNEDNLDILDLYCDIFFRARNNGANASDIDSMIKAMEERLTQFTSIDQDLLSKRIVSFQTKAASVRETKPLSTLDATIHEELHKSLDIILGYTELKEETVSEFTKYFDMYKKIPDRSAADKEADQVRRHLTKLFYQIYNEIIVTALKTEQIPVIVKMFINFGYMDPELCGFDNAVALYKITENYHGLRDQGIYTFFEWMQEIYSGRKQPSRNEFEQDYAGYIRELKRERKINKEEEVRMLSDRMGKVMYELQSVFPQVNKVTFGRVFSYCPILLEENLLKPFDDLLMTPKKIIEIFEHIVTIDYSAFYHEILFEDQKANLKENVQIDIRPDVILMPNVGVKGILWQEIEGMHRTTPGRMMISALHMENADKTFIRMTGEFRWEMCKRTMGARWNDFSSHSLTSDYCSYAQFFSKNRDLSYDAKEKIKETLKRCKNSFKEMFVRDYIVFVQNESAGSSRLNKVVRGILFQHCPFTQEICQNLQGNGAFIDYLDKYRIRKAQYMHHLNQVLQKYQNSGLPVPEEIASQKELMDK